ncbi:Ni/Fe hydrogenase subunit alpha [Leptothoe spongobia]|uniref:Ni/Fe hydrogenase subunit alpha n=1 Tax=Leptothoe spongobia TAU-MAC 1115 TaxID=1967444 RepID=A0A947DGD8_9CYAN|nr:nickel-dependent hydrogenase large subunit [Leptothoe spongobia]MBT9315914.1 Ni/Fe hydrogenase subunit alpha [Leptothoe spongobia TAU-MAC 1115]
MSKRIVINPVTRIEGHAKISIYLDDRGEVSDARFHVTEFRGFEKFCEGRPFWEMPGLTARICGICPISHLLASAKTGDRLLAVQIPPAAEKLRRLMNLGQIIQSHALSFFHLSSPDLLLGWESNPIQRNVFGVMAAEPELARGGIQLRQFGQEVIKQLGGCKIHPAWAVPGGVRGSLSLAGREQIRQHLPKAKKTILETLTLFKQLLEDFQEEAHIFGNFSSLFMGLVSTDGTWEHYDGCLRMVDSGGNVIADRLDSSDYRDFIGEAVQPDSYLKSPYYKPLGYPDQTQHCRLENGLYRVGPLARLNVCDRIGTPLAETELQRFRQYGMSNSSFFYHYARLIEILTCIERIEIALDDPDLQSERLRASADVNQLEAVGVGEAPRGTLFHHYKIDETGLLTYVNLIIATGQNNLAMNRTVAQIARHYIHGSEIPEPMLNRVEAGIRAFDPCLSCSTHAAGKMPLQIQLLDADGQLLDECYR